MRGRSEDLLDGTGLDHFAGIHHRDMLRHARHDPEIMRD